MKKQLCVILIMLLMMTVLTACGSSDQGSESASEDTAVQSVEESEAAVEDINEGKNIVIYFDYSENIDTTGLDVDAISSASLRGGSTGKNIENLKVMADEAVSLKNADEFSIQINEVYPPEFEEMTGIAESDISNNKQFTFKKSLDNLDDYDTVYFGVPVWWGELPQPVHVFFQQYDFSGKTIVPFGIHHGSRFGRMIEQMREYEPDAEVLDGFTIDADTDNEDVKSEFDEYLNSFS